MIQHKDAGRNYLDVCQEILDLAKGLKLTPLMFAHAASLSGCHTVRPDRWPSAQELYESHASGETFWILDLRDRLQAGKAARDEA